MAVKNVPNTIELDSWCQEADPLSAFAEEPPRPSTPLTPLSVRPNRSARTVTGVAAIAFVAVATLVALNEVRTSVAGEREVVTARDSRTVAIPPRTTLDRLLGQSGFEPISSAVEAPRAAEVAPKVDRPVAETWTDRSIPGGIPSPQATRQIALEEPLRRVPPAVVAASAPIERTLARLEEPALAAVLPSATATPGMATVALPSPGAPPPSIVAARGAMPLNAAPAVPLPSPPRAVAASAAIDSVLTRYESAFSALDARSAKTVWPSVNERNLERAFDSLESQEFDLGSCDIAVTPPRAVATCDGNARYVPKVGRREPRSERRRWTFQLQQSGQDWAIESVDAR